MLSDHRTNWARTCATSNKFGALNVSFWSPLRPCVHGAEEATGEENGQKETKQRTLKFSSTSLLQAAQGQLQRPCSLPRASGRVPLPACLGNSVPHAGAPENFPCLENRRGLWGAWEATLLTVRATRPRQHPSPQPSLPACGSAGIERAASLRQPPLASAYQVMCVGDRTLHRRAGHKPYCESSSNPSLEQGRINK